MPGTWSDFFWDYSVGLVYSSAKTPVAVAAEIKEDKSVPPVISQESSQNTHTLVHQKIVETKDSTTENRIDVPAPTKIEDSVPSNISIPKPISLVRSNANSKPRLWSDVVKGSLKNNPPTSDHPANTNSLRRS